MQTRIAQYAIFKEWVKRQWCKSAASISFILIVSQEEFSRNGIKINKISVCLVEQEALVNKIKILMRM